MYSKATLDRHQTILYNSMEDWISEDNPVRVIDIMVDNIYKKNPEKFIYKGKKSIGRKPYPSQAMLKLYIHGYMNRISSSRRLEAETKRNMEVKWLTGNLQPDFKTIADYRKDNGETIKFVFLAFRTFLKTEGYIEGKKNHL